MLPESFNPCVWMTAGLVAYKLCDRSFECERCPLDRALRGEPGDFVPIRTDLSPRATAPDFRNDRRYHRSHTWVKAKQGGSFRVGVDVLAASVLPPPRAVIFPASGAIVCQGRAGCWLEDEGGPIPLKMPVSGVVIRANEKLRAHPSLLLDAPYDGGWLLELCCPEAARESAKLMSAEAMRLQSQTDLRRLHRRLALLLRAPTVGACPTLADGGQPVADLRKTLGPSRYRGLILELLR